MSRATRKRTTQRPRTQTHPTPVALPEPHLRPVPPTGTRTGISLTKTRAPLPRRSHDFMDLASIRAHLAARIAGLPIPGRITDWIATRPADTGATWTRGPHSTLTHTPGGPSPFHASIPCRTGAAHQHLITDGRSLHKAELATWSCTSGHGADDLLARRAKALGDGVAQIHSTTADTVQTDVSDLRDDDTAKEHPAHD